MLQEREIIPFAEVIAGAQTPQARSNILYDKKSFCHGEQPSRSMTIRLANNDDDRDLARDIINRMYNWRGYGSDHQIADRPDCATFVASSERDMLGTLTLTIDSAAGLAADETFPEELQQLRSIPGASLCELTKFAFDPSPGSRPLLATLFHVIYIYGMQRFACTDLLIEVNPRHVRFYEVMLGFKRLGMLRVNESVNAPSQLMHLKVADIRRNIDLLSECECYSGHSLYPFFLNKEDEHALWVHMASIIDGQIFASDRISDLAAGNSSWRSGASNKALHC